MIIPSVYGCFVDGMDKIYATNTHDAQPKPLTSKNDIGLPIRRFYVYPSVYPSSLVPKWLLWSHVMQWRGLQHHQMDGVNSYPILWQSTYPIVGSLPIKITPRS